MTSEESPTEIVSPAVFVPLLLIFIVFLITEAVLKGERNTKLDETHLFRRINFICTKQETGSTRTRVNGIREIREHQILIFLPAGVRSSVNSI